jgi:hypothetical protein
VIIIKTKVLLPKAYIVGALIRPFGVGAPKDF